MLKQRHVSAGETEWPAFHPLPEVQSIYDLRHAYNMLRGNRNTVLVKYRATRRGESGKHFWEPKSSRNESRSGNILHRQRKD